MISNRAPLLIVLLLLAAGGAWFAFGRGGEAPPAPANASQGDEPRTAEQLPGLIGQPESEDPTGVRSPTGPGLVGTVTRDGQPVLAEVRVWRISGISMLNPRRSDYEDGAGPSAGPLQLMFGMGQGMPIRTAETDAHGAYHVASLPTGTFLLWARDEQGRMGVGHVVVPQTGLLQRVDIAVANGEHELQIRVLRREGEPYAGPINLMSMGGRGSDSRGPLGQIETDATGRATLSGLPTGQVILAARPREGVIAYSSGLSLPHQGEFLWTLGARDEALTGRVFAADNKQPVAGAHVQIMAGNKEGGVTVDLTTDANGRFQAVIGAMAPAVTVSAPGFAQAQAGFRGREPLEIALVRTTAIRGRVIDKATRRALPDVRVIGAQLGRVRGTQRQIASETDTEGRFVLEGLPPGQAMVFALGAGWLSDGLWQVEETGFNPLAVTVPATGLSDLEIIAVPGAEVEGVVLDSAGQPVEGTLVTPLRRGRALVPGLRMWTAGIEGVASTDAQGRFTFDTLVPERTYAFKAEHGDKPTAESDEVLLKGNVAPQRIEIRLPAERTLEITVTDRSSGAAVPGARIRVRETTDSGARGIDGEWFSGPGGRVRITGLPAAALEVRVEARRYLDSDPVPVSAGPPGAMAAPVTVLMDLGVEIRGSLVLPEGLTPGRVSMEADGRGDNMGYADVTVASDGSFVAEGLAPGPYRLTARARTADRTRYEGSLEVTAPADGVRVQLTPSGGPVRSGSAPDNSGEKQVEVEVVGSDGQRITQAKVTMLQRGSTSGTSIGQDGLARIKLRRPVEFRIQVRRLPTSAKGAPGTYGPYPGVGGRLRIQLDEGLPISGRVVDESGQGLKGVKVQVAEELPDRNQRPDPFLYDRDLRATHTDKDGAFNLGSYKPGPHLLKVSAAKEFIVQDPLSVTPQAAPLQITLHRGAEATVRVVDPAEQPVVGCWVSASIKRKDAGPFNASQLGSRSQTDENGVARLQGLDRSATYVLAVSINARTNPNVMSHSQADWTPSDETIRLPRAYVTKGIARNLSGNPVAEATVWYRAPGDSGASGTRTDKEGRFTIGPDARPKLELKALPPSRRIGFDADDAEWTRIEAGRDDVELSFDAGVSLTISVRPWNNESTAEMSVSEVGSGSSFGIRSPGMPPSGTLQLKSLRRDATYRIWISPDADGNYVDESEVRGDAGRVTFTSKRGRTVSGAVTVPADLDVSKVDVQAYPSRGSFGQVVRGKVGKDGHYELRGVPEGDWSIQASWSYGFSIVKSVKIPADGRVDLVLERE